MIHQDHHALLVIRLFWVHSRISLSLSRCPGSQRDPTCPIDVGELLRALLSHSTRQALFFLSPSGAFDPKLTILPTVYRQEVVYTCCHAVPFCSWATLCFTRESMDSTWITACPHSLLPNLNFHTSQQYPTSAFSILMGTGSFSHSKLLVSVFVQ